MDPLKEAFLRVKEDINSLRDELNSLRKEVLDIKSYLSFPKKDPTNTPHSTDKPTDKPTDNTIKMGLQSPYHQNFQVSTGNNGVPTDKQTNQQTNQQTNHPQNDPISEFKRAKEILSSLDEVKKKIYYLFKSLTDQEMKVFATIYDLENKGDEPITYRKIAEILSLSESSIRDYVNKITKKGVSIEKTRVNNKIIHLKIAESIKSIAPLPTILKLREF